MLSYDPLDWAQSLGARLSLVSSEEPEKSPSSHATEPSKFGATESDDRPRYTGTVEFFSKVQGFGFIKLNKEGIVPEERVYCHWSNIKSATRFTHLEKGIQVEFSIDERADLAAAATGDTKTKYRALNVTHVGGEMLVMEDARRDKSLKSFVGGQQARYSGTLKFFIPEKKYGYVSLDDWQTIGLPHPDVRLEPKDLWTADKPKEWISNVRVELGIWMAPKGQYKAYNVTLPGRRPVTPDEVAGRTSPAQGADKLLTGRIKIFRQMQEWGFIRVDPDCELPEALRDAITQNSKDARQKALKEGKQPNARMEAELEEDLLYFNFKDFVKVPWGSFGCPYTMPIQKGSRVRFIAYVDPKGAGAREIRLIPDWPKKQERDPCSSSSVATPSVQPGAPSTAAEEVASLQLLSKNIGQDQPSSEVEREVSETHPDAPAHQSDFM